MNSAQNVRRILSNVDWSFFNSTTSDLNQIHPYPAKFIEQIPDVLLDAFKVDNNLCILDPFMGSGTTLVEAKKRGYNTIGIDLNPIAYLITSVKTHALPDDFLTIVDKVCQKSALCLEQSKFSQISISNVKHWFSENVYEALASLVTVVRKMKIDDLSSKALLLAISSIVVKVSYQESDTRYAAKDNYYKAKDVFIFFKEAAKKIYKAVKKANLPNRDVMIYQASSIDFDYKNFVNKVGAVITSPPYPNAYEYWLYHKFRMEFLGYDAKKIKKQEIGTRTRYFRSKPESIKVFEQQMSNVMQMCYNVLVNNGFMAIVVGRSVIRGIEYDNAEMISKIGSNLGFQKVANFKRPILTTKKSFNPKNSKINSENVIIFQKV